MAKIIVGLTGGIGSGKSTVALIFKDLGVPVYMADIAARERMESSPDVRKAIIAAFGKESYHHNTPNTKFLAAIVFKEKEKLHQLNAIIHPEVQQHFLGWYNQQKSIYAIKESAILFESGSHRFCDKILTVIAPVTTRIQRVMKRDQVTEQMVLDRIENQWSDEKKIEVSDYIIENITLKKTAKKVKEIHNTLIKNYS